MSRLTKDLRERMARCILNNAFSEKETTLDQLNRDIGDKIYQDIYGDYLKSMEALPDHWLDNSSYVCIAIAGQTHNVYFNTRKIIGREHYSRYSKAKLYVGDEEVCQEFLKAVEARQDLKKQRESMGREVEAILNSVQTFKKLWEIWPESKPVLEKFESKPTVAMLPAIQFEKVNAALGLTSGAIA